ncbi:MAG: M23 family metallopeptidase [Prevotellaceae bacterium]|nr:M23 family metallopeptidase [Prevotellaceae bacterium]
MAVSDGVVDKVWNDTSAGGGLSVRVAHDGGYTTGFAHLSQQLVTVGQKVNQGDTIAKTGNTGNSTGAHLHFTLKYNGVAIDPQLYFYK